MGDDMEEEEREQDRRKRIVKSLHDLIQDMMLKMNVKNLMRLRKALEEVVEEEEERYGRRGGLENSAVNRVSGLIFIALLAKTPFFNRAPIAEEEMIRCLSLVLRRCDIEEYKLFSDVHTYLLDAVTDSPFMPIVKPLSEEMKMSVLASWSQMSRGSPPRVREKVWEEAYRGKLGHTIYLCLSFAKNETSKSLRLQAIHTVQDLGWKDACPSLTKQEKDSLSGTFVNFLPGIIQAMTKVATGSDTQGSKIIAAAVDTWSYYVTLVMGDSYLSSHVPHLGESVSLVNLRHNLERGESGGGGYEINEEEEEEEEEKGMEFDHFGRPTLPNMKVTRKWVRKTEGKVGVLAGALTPLATHQHWLVRHSMALWAAALVTECVRALPSCLSPALEVLLTLRQDDMEEVVDAAVEAMGKLREALAGEGGGGRQKLEELVKKKVISLSTRLPSIVRQEDDAKMLGAVRQLEGCLEVLGGRGMQPLLSSPNVHRLLHSLSLLLSLNTADSHLLHQRSSALDPFEAPLLKPHMGSSFTHFRDKRILEVVGRACGLLGRHGELVRLVHLCVDLLHLHTTTHLYSEGLLLLSLVLDGVQVGTTDTEVEERQHSVQLILDEVLSPEVLGSHLLCTLEEENTLASLLTPLPSPSSPVEGTRVRVVRVIQALGVVRASARLMGHNFTQFLSIILCPVMEFAGLANMAVSLAATEALKRMSEACGCVDVGEFIRESTPHLWYPLSMRLKRLTEYPAAAVVLQVALRYTGTKMQAFTEELVEEAVMALDQHHVQAADPMLRVLLAYVSVVAAEEASKNYSGTQDSENGDCGAENSGKGDSKGENGAKSDSPVVSTFKGDFATLNNINGDSKRQNSSKCDSNGQSSVQGDCAVDAACTGDSVTLNSEKGNSKGQNNNKGEEEENEEGVEKVKVEEEESEKVMEVVGIEESGEDVNKEEAEEEVMQEIKTEYHGAIAKFLQEYHNTKMTIKRGLEEEKEKERLTEEEERMNWETEKMSISHNTSSNPPPPAHTPSPPPEPTEPTPPRNIELVRDVVERCSYLLHVGGREGRLLTLEVARWGCRALRNWENLLLPCTHKLWRPILLLLSQPDPVVGTRALALVSELVALSGDFLRRRVLQEALPLVLKFLKSQASVSIGAKECQTPALKAQRTCLTTLATLIPALQLGVTEAGSVVGVVGSYLDPHHPPDLFHGALGVLRVMSRSHPHHVWLALALRRPPVQLIHPSHYIPAVKIGSTRHQGPLPTEAEELFQELS